MRSSVASFFLVLCFLSANTLGQDNGRRVKRNPAQSGTLKNTTPRSGLLKVCQGLPIPEGYVIVSYETSSACPHGAYVLRKDDTQNPSVQRATQTAAPANTASRPRKVNTGQVPQMDSLLPPAAATNSGSNLRAPTLSGVPLGASVSAAPTDLSPAVEEVGEGDVVRIDTNLVTVPVSVMDRQGRFVPDLKKEAFSVFENGVEQRIAYFEPTEKPFTVALLLDTSASTHFQLPEIKEAAIAFAKQLRPQDRVLVVTFNEQVLLLTEVTNDLKVVTGVIDRYATSGTSTRLYDAIDLVINERLNKIQGRKAIVLFTDGVDTSSYLATYESTLREAEELDALIYPIQYDTIDFLRSMQGSNVSIVTTTTNNWPYPGKTTSHVVYGPPRPSVQLPSSIWDDYEKADHYLHQLADKSGARLFQANDPQQLAQAFSKIAEELRRQYSLGYYPQTPVQSGERREIKVHINQPELAVRARGSYMQKSPPKQQSQ
jgi:VWFA-related protein